MANLQLANAQDADINYLRKLMALGQLSNEDLNSGSLDVREDTPPPVNMLNRMQRDAQVPQDALSRAVPGQGFQGLQSGQGVVQAGDGPVIRINAQPQTPMGGSNGIQQVSPLTKSTEPDVTRPIEIAGMGKGYYAKDGRSAIINGQQVMLGYDRAGTERLQDRQMKLNKFNLDQRTGESNIAHTQSSIDHTAEQIRASQANNPDFSANGQSGGNLTGEEFLATLQPGIANQVRQIANGDIAPPRTINGKANPIMMAVTQFDPSFDATDFTRRQKTAQGFSAGKQGDAVKSVNQTIAHMGSLNDAIDNLDNFNGMATPLNSIVNPVEKMFGDPRQGVMQQKVQAVASELRKVFSNSGNSGSLTELKQWEDSMPVNASKEQQKAYLASGVDLLQGAIGALKDQYDRGMGKRGDFSKLVSPQALQTLDRLKGGLPQDQSTDEPPAANRPILDSSKNALIEEAKQAIARGAPKDAVNQRLRAQGLGPL